MKDEGLNLNRPNEGLYFDPPPKDRLAQMMDNQFRMQRDTYGIDYATLTDEQRIHHFKEMLHAFNDEMHEALGEMGWKPWATSKHFNMEAVQGELIDAWHFFMNLMMISGMTPQDVFEKYQAKAAKNVKRQQEGYDGVSTKCVGCKRALDDDAVNCHTSEIRRGNRFVPGHCCHASGNDMGELIPLVQ